MKIELKYISSEIMDTTTVDSSEQSFLLHWKVEYTVRLETNHYLTGKLYWHEKDFIVDDVIAAIKKDLPKYTENENNS